MLVLVGLAGCSSRPDARAPDSNATETKETRAASDTKDAKGSPVTEDTKGAVAEEIEKKTGIEIPKIVNVTPGSATRLGPMPKRTKLWTVQWKGARLDFRGEGKFSGEMERVTGMLYDEQGKVASTFQGERGEADEQQDILRLSGSVKIISNEHRATMLCDKVEYLPERKRLRAIGNVRIETQNGILDAGNEILATPDLRHVATPNLFRP